MFVVERTSTYNTIFVSEKNTNILKLFQLEFICDRIYDLLDPYKTGALFLDNVPFLVQKLDHYTGRLVETVLE